MEKHRFGGTQGKVKVAVVIFQKFGSIPSGSFRGVTSILLFKCLVKRYRRSIDWGGFKFESLIGIAAYIAKNGFK